MSRTVTPNVHELMFPASSVAVHVTVVIPIGNVLPEAGAHVTIGARSHVSVAGGVG